MSGEYFVSKPLLDLPVSFKQRLNAIAYHLTD